MTVLSPVARRTKAARLVPPLSGATRNATVMFSGPTSAAMMLHVFGLSGKELQVFKAIVRAVAVDVVDYFARFKASLQVLLHHEPMLKNIYLVPPDGRVAGCVTLNIASGMSDPPNTLAASARTEPRTCIYTTAFEGLVNRGSGYIQALCQLLNGLVMVDVQRLNLFVIDSALTGTAASERAVGLGVTALEDRPAMGAS
jgi:hypothetical protein